MSNILPEAEVSHLHNAPSHGERCETSCFALRPVIVSLNKVNGFPDAFGLFPLLLVILSA
jgi:hypothetical protein